jgi:hypothetical protein
MSTLPLSNVVDVSIAVGPVSAVRTNFNLGLIIGKSTLISTSDRISIYQKIEDMIADGWAGTEPEFLAAQKYFSQNPRPARVAIGVQGASETAVQAVTACRQANSEWYICTVCGAEKADIIAVANYIEGCYPDSLYCYTTSDSEVLAGTTGNVMETLKNNKIRRTMGQYSTKEDDAVIAIAGYAMGANTQTSNSAYTLDNKTEVGVEPEDLTSTQASRIWGLNGNILVNLGSTYNVFKYGKMADGVFFDEVLNLDILKNNIQVAVMNALTSESKIAQTDPGMDKLLNYITAPLETAKSIDFIAPGVWNTSGILSVNKGDTLPNGYIVLADSVANQSQADREARKSPPIYILCKLAGAIQQVSIGVYVNR